VCFRVSARLNDEEVAAEYVNHDDADDAMIADYLASQLGDFECVPDEPGVPREWPKGHSSKLLGQTL